MESEDIIREVERYKKQASQLDPRSVVVPLGKMKAVIRRMMKANDQRTREAEMVKEFRADLVRDGDYVVSGWNGKFPCKWIAKVFGNDFDSEGYDTYYGMYIEGGTRAEDGVWVGSGQEPSFCDAQEWNRRATIAEIARLDNAVREYLKKKQKENGK